MKSAALIALLVTFTGIVVAQIPASGPANTQSDTQPGAATTATSVVAETAPSTLPGTMPMASTAPTTNVASTTSTAPTTNLAGTTSTSPTTNVARAASTSPVTMETDDTSDDRSSSSHSRSHRSRRDYRTPTPPMASAPAGPLLTPRQITREFYPVLSRSIFIKGRQEVVDTASFPDRSREFAPTTAFATSAPTSEPAPWTPESTLVFNGASDANGQIVAFIENTALNLISKFHVGDAVAQGKLAALTLDSLDYQVGSRVTHVMLGQNLQGIDMQVLTTQPVSSTTAPSTADSPGGADSVLERLRRRRLQELGQ